MNYIFQSSPYLSATGYVDNLNDQYLGRIGSSTQFLGLLGKAFVLNLNPGQLVDSGIYCSAIAAAQPPAVAATKNLYAGTYQIVKKVASITVAYGQIAYWSDKKNFTVTNAAGSSIINEVAGIFLNAATDSYYCYIHAAVPGEDVDMLLVDTPTKSAAIESNDIIMASSTAGKGDVLADATALSGGNYFPIARARGAQDSTTKLVYATFGTGIL